MMIGQALFKLDFLAGRSRGRAYRLAIAIAVPSLAAIGWMCWRADVLETPVTGMSTALLVLSPLVALGYTAGLMLLLQISVAGAMAPLAAAGRMAFTNYLTQSLVMTTIFYGGRGALMGRMDRARISGAHGRALTLQLICSPLWLAQFEMGPFEWAWRCLNVSLEALESIGSG